MWVRLMTGPVQIFNYLCFCFVQVLLDNLDQLPGDGRTRVGFLSYNKNVHFYRLNEGLAQPQMIIVSDTDG